MSFLGPAFGIAWGALVLGEPRGPGLVLGAGLGNLFFSAPLPYRISLLAAGIWIALVTLGSVLATEAAALGMRQRDEAADPALPAQPGGVHPFSGEAGDLRRAHAHRQDEPHALGRNACARLVGTRRGNQRATIGHGAGADFGDA